MRTTIDFNNVQTPKLRNQKSTFSPRQPSLRRKMSSTAAPTRNLRSSSAASIVRPQPAQSYAPVPAATDATGDANNTAPVAQPTSAPAATAATTAPIPAANDKDTTGVPVSTAVAAAAAAADGNKGSGAAPAKKVTLTKPKQTITPENNEGQYEGTGEADIRPGEASLPLARAIAEPPVIFTAAEDEFIQTIRAKEKSLRDMAPITKNKATKPTITKDKAPVPAHDVPEGFEAGEKWETVKKTGKKGKGKARAPSPTPSLSSLMEGDRTPSPGPSRPRARFEAGARRSPKHRRDWNSGSDSDDRSTTRARSPPFFKRTRANEQGAFRVTSPSPERSRSPTPFTANAVPDNGKDDTTFFDDMPDVHDQDPTSFVAKQNPQQADLWNRIDDPKFRVLISGSNKASAASTVRNALAHHFAINPDSFNVGQAVGDHQSLVVSGLQPALASQLMRKGCTSSGAYMRFRQFSLEVPHYIGTLSGFVPGLSSPEQMKQTVTEGIRAKIASNTGIHAMVAKYRDLAPLGMPAMTIAKHMADYLWVEPIDIGVTGGDVETAYNVYCHHPSNHPAYMSKLRSVITKYEFSVVTEYNEEGRFLKNLFKCGICFGIDHPTGLCVLPHLVNWNGPTPLSLDAQRAALAADRDNGHRDSSDGNRSRESRGHRGNNRRAGGNRGAHA
ncbi:hypothetical protein C8J56DRAFT_932272 [Mycena floridula]|nr:hypothetical protein C8J56DRAFT_932272 [Mycena floridula]